MTFGRRTWLAAVAASIAASLLDACAPKKPAEVAVAKPLAPLHALPITDLVPAAGLGWLVVVRPVELFSAPDLVAPLASLVPNGGLDAFRETTGVDLRTMPSALAAGFDRSTLYLGASTFDPAVVEAKFRDRLLQEGPRVAPRPDLVRVAGRIGSSLDTLVVLGRDAVAVAVGDPLPARAAEAYALGRLKSPSALAAPPLAPVAAKLGDAPVLAFAPGPLEGEWGDAARGLLRAASAVGVAVRPSPRAGLRVRGIVAGDYARDPSRAAELLSSAWNDLAASAIGRLSGLDVPRQPPTVSAAADALTLEVELDAVALLRGLRDAVLSEARDIMKLPPRRPP